MPRIGRATIARMIANKVCAQCAFGEGEVPWRAYSDRRNRVRIVKSVAGRELWVDSLTVERIESSGRATFRIRSFMDSVEKEKNGGRKWVCGHFIRLLMDAVNKQFCLEELTELGCPELLLGGVGDDFLDPVGWLALADWCEENGAGVHLIEELREFAE